MNPISELVSSTHASANNAQTNVFPPESISPSLAVSLLRQQDRSKLRREGRRKKAFPKKRELNFPIPDIGDDIPKSTYNHRIGRFVTSTTDSYGTRLISWLDSQALRLINLDAARPMTRMTLQELREYVPPAQRFSDHLYTLAMEAGRNYLATTNIDEVKLADLCDTAVAFAMENWKADFLSRLSQAGSKGGSRSKRGKTYTPEMLAGLENLTVAEQAAALGCSTRTINTLRKQLVTTQTKPSEEMSTKMTAKNPTRRTEKAKDVAKAQGVSTRTVQRQQAEPRDRFIRRSIARENSAWAFKEAGLTDREIAESLHVTYSTVTNLIKRARKRRGLTVPRDRADTPKDDSQN